MKTSSKQQITFARVTGYDAAIAAAANADVHVIAAEGELGETEVTALADEMVRLACASKCAIVLDLSAVHHFDYRQVRSLAARARLLRSTVAGRITPSSPSSSRRSTAAPARAHTPARVGS